MTTPEPIIEVIGGDTPSDELLEWLADFLLDLDEAEDSHV